ncbi:MAG: hypothetical protein ACJAYU_002222 [Bradymonadia bacterium]|jgi:hypothetical protein
MEDLPEFEWDSSVDAQIPDDAEDSAADTSEDSAADTSEDSAADTSEDSAADTSEDSADADECRTLGCPCDENSDCNADFCARHPDGGQVCSEFCGEECSEEGYECRTLQDGSGDLVRYCVPTGDLYCAPCEIDADCLTTDNLCVAFNDGRFCATGCAAGEPCPAGASCIGVGVGDASVLVCAPDGNQCTACLDNDEDGRGVGPGCLGFDCDDDNPAVFEGAPEFCDGLDNDCDDFADEDFTELGSTCGTCDSGMFECADLVSACVGDLGDDALNACGTCEASANACGGCTPLDGAIGDMCGPCAAVLGCDGAEAFACVGDLTDTDSDTICDVDDVCPGGDDRVDTDGDGVPDGCDGPPPECSGASDCGTDFGSEWSVCADLSSTCDESGTRNRNFTTYECVAGVCGSRVAADSEACARPTTGTTCGAGPTYGEWGVCGEFAGTCGELGTRSRSVTTYACAGGACEPTVSSQNEACARTTTGTGCDTTSYTEWSTCSSFATTCGEFGTQSRTRTEYGCFFGSCIPIESVENQDCRRVTDGVSCGDPEFGEWGSCRFFGECGENGTRSRSRTDYVCGDGSCNSTESEEGVSCVRDTDGVWCEDWPGCSFGRCAEGVCPVGRGCGSGRCCEPGICISGGEVCP